MSKPKQEEVSKKTEKTFNYVDCATIQSLIKEVDTKSLESAAAMMNLLKLKREVDDRMIELQEARNQVFEKFNVVAENGKFDWSQHVNKKEISEMIGELEMQTVDLKNVHFLDGEELFAIAKGFNLEVVDYLESILVK